MKIFLRLLTKELPHPQGKKSSKILHLLFDKYLLVTNVVTSGLLMGIGDIASQKIEKWKTKEPLDRNRIIQMMIVGSVQGPIYHFAYKWMDDKFPKVNLKNVVRKISIDEFLMSPMCITTFFLLAGTLEGKTVKEAAKELRNKFLTVYMADWCVWPPTQFINFYFLPTRYRVAYVNIITMMYNIFLSYIKHKH